VAATNLPPTRHKRMCRAHLASLLARHPATARQTAKFRQGFTIVEILVVVLILAVLAALILPNTGRLMAAANEAVCASNMRSIRLGLDYYMQDHKGVWPQGPHPQEPGWGDFWVQQLEPYGIKRKTWQCRVIRSWAREAGDDAPELHYVPTMFDPTPNIAHRWSTQPWLIEIADAHGKGPLMAFQDGTVKSYSKVLAEQGVR